MVMAAGLRRVLKGLSEVAFRERFGTEEACRKALFEMRWRQGLTCPACGHKRFCQLTTRELDCSAEAVERADQQPKAGWP